MSYFESVVRSFLGYIYRTMGKRIAIFVLAAIALIASIYLALRDTSKEYSAQPQCYGQHQAPPIPFVYPYGNWNQGYEKTPEGPSVNRHITSEWMLVFVGIITFGFVAWQAVATEESAKATTKAAEATLKQAAYMVNSERPFIIVETRGDKGTEFWMRNCGKSPAQILFLDTGLIPDYPVWVGERQEFALSERPDYGPHYWDDQWQQINVQWLGPGDSKCFASFDSGCLRDLPDEMRAEIRSGIRAVRLYSSIKYRGMFSPDIYHSRFCYGWGPAGTYMTGPHGYNKYT